MTTVLVILAVIAGVVGGCYQMEKEMIGVGFIAIACLLGILGRIAQAEQQHKAVMKGDPDAAKKKEPWLRIGGRGYEFDPSKLKDPPPEPPPPPPKRRKG